MLVKNKREDHHLDYLWETFETLHLYNMKLNPSKCVFGVSSGKLLGFTVYQQGVEANLTKFKHIGNGTSKEHQEAVEFERKGCSP